MKRSKLFTLLLVVTLATIATLFHACQKDEITNNSDIAEFIEKDYDAYIEELMANTGIDVYELSKLDEVQKTSNKQLALMNTTAAMFDIKGDWTEEILYQLQDLANAIDAAYVAGDEDEVFRLFESFCAICMTIDGFIFEMNEYGVQTFTYNPNQAPILIPALFIEAEMRDAALLIEEVENNYPLYSTLPVLTQKEVLAAALFVNVLNNIETKNYSVSDCEKAAQADYAIAMAGCIVGLEIAMHGCIFSGPTVGACIATAFAGYGVAVGFATWGYRRALKRCG